MKALSAPISKVLIPMVTALCMQPVVSYSQQMYDDYEGSKSITYSFNRAAHVDSAAANPKMDDVNSSAKCFKYMRTRLKYDCIKIYPMGQIADVSQFASYEENAPKMKMKLYTTAPVGTIIELQLGKKTGNPYPEGTHSQFQAKTTVTNGWQELEFNYALSPKGSMTQPGEIDQVTLLFNPNSLTNDVYYFDELTGPTINRTQQTAKAGRKR
jgi:hypothetical protein